MSEIKLAIIEDDPIIADDIATICARSGYQIAGIAHEAVDALQIFEQSDLDLALLDINLEEDIDGIDLATYLSKEKEIPFIYITSYSDANTLNRAKATHPLAYIVKPFSQNQIVSTIEIALYNYAQKQLPGLLSLNDLNQLLTFPLSDREFAILSHIYNGKNNQQMAQAEYVSVNTIKYHIKGLYQKLEVNSRTSLLAALRLLINS